MAKARVFIGLDQTEMADRLGVSRRTVSRLETGQHQPTRAVLIAWAYVTGVPLEWLECDELDARTQQEHPSGWNEVWAGQPVPPLLVSA